MATWVIGVAALSIAATAALAWILMRINAPALERHDRQHGDGGAAPTAGADGDSGGDGGGD